MTLHQVTAQPEVKYPTNKVPPRTAIRLRPVGLPDRPNGWEASSISCSSAFVYGKTGIMPRYVTACAFDTIFMQVYVQTATGWYVGSPDGLTLRERIHHDEYLRYFRE